MREALGGMTSGRWLPQNRATGVHQASSVVQSCDFTTLIPWLAETKHYPT